MIKEKVCLFLENKLGLTKRFNCTFCLNNSGFEVYLFQLIALLKSDFSCCNNFTETSVMKELNHRIMILPLCFCLCFSLKNIFISVLEQTLVLHLLDKVVVKFFANPLQYKIKVDNLIKLLQR